MRAEERRTEEQKRTEQVACPAHKQRCCVQNQNTHAMQNENL